MKNALVALCLAAGAAVPSLSWAQVVAAKEGTLPSLAPLVESVKGAVVNVDVQKRASDEQQQIERLLPRRRMGRGAEEPLNSGMGSGFIIDPRGIVLTNNHVVEGAVNIRVRLDDGRSFDAEVQGRDPLTDVAVIKLKGKIDQLPALKLGDSSQMRVGDWVVAIGNPFGLSSSVSAGIISALDRQIGVSRNYDQFLQTDAAINPGNSGGPLFNLKGEVIGINSAIIGSATGIGFAVPSSLVKALLPQLEKDGVVTRGWLGVGIQDLNPSLAKALAVPVSEGALISSVNEGSPAEKGGVKPEDVVTSIDGEKVTSANTLTRAVALKRPDSTVTLTLFRAGKPVDAKVKIGVRPDLEGLGDLDRRNEHSEGTKQRIGLSFQDVDPRASEGAGLPKAGAQIVDVSPGSPAERAGFVPGMVVTEVNRKPVRSRDELMQNLKDLKPGAVLLMKIAVPGGGANRSLVAVEVP